MHINWFHISVDIFLCKAREIFYQWYVKKNNYDTSMTTFFNNTYNSTTFLRIGEDDAKMKKKNRK
jgi:hypothetical protein